MLPEVFLWWQMIEKIITMGYVFDRVYKHGNGSTWLNLCLDCRNHCCLRREQVYWSSRVKWGKMKGIIKSGGIGVFTHRTTTIQITHFLTLPLLPVLFRFAFKSPWANIMKGFCFILPCQISLLSIEKSPGLVPELSCNPCRVGAK